jgi:hypothetical protein
MVGVQSPQYWDHGKKSHGPTPSTSPSNSFVTPIFLSSHLAVVFSGILVMITMIMAGTSVDICWRGLWGNTAVDRGRSLEHHLTTVLGTYCSGLNIMAFRFLSLSA